MRYITYYSNLVLYKNDGTLHTRFGKYGVYIKGSLITETGAANKIDPDTTSALMRVYPTDLAAGTTYSIELCGQGSLVQVDENGDSLTNLADGYRGTFFKSPVITGTTAVSSIAKVAYEVLSGTVTYNGTTYRVGQIFVTDGSATATTGSGTFALAIPTAISNSCDAFLDEHFKIKNMQLGDEASAYYLFNGGFDPKAAIGGSNSANPDYYAWTR